MKQNKRTYLMIGGTLLPAFVGVSVAVAMRKGATLNTWDLLLFAGLSVVGGYVTAKTLEGIEMVK